MAESTMGRVVAVFEQVFKARGLPVPTLAPTSRLDGSLGLESLDLAEIVVRLETEFGIDPFAGGTPPQVGTLGDLVALYD